VELVYIVKVLFLTGLFQRGDQVLTPLTLERMSIRTLAPRRRAWQNLCHTTRANAAHSSKQKKKKKKGRGVGKPQNLSRVDAVAD
jgi:hypothetical protein